MRGFLAALLAVCGCAAPLTPPYHGEVFYPEGERRTYTPPPEVQFSGGPISITVCYGRIEDAGAWVQEQNRLRTGAAEIDEALRRSTTVYRRDGTEEAATASARRANPQQVADRVSLLDESGCVPVVTSGRALPR